MTADPVSLAKRLGEACLARQQALATAESCTGGLASAILSQCPGASRWFIGAIVCYQDALKQSLLDVDGGLIASHGVVSQPVADAMAQGLSRRFPGALALSVTGWLDNAPPTNAQGHSEPPASPAIRKLFPDTSQHAPAATPGRVWLGLCQHSPTGPGEPIGQPVLCEQRRIQLSCADRDRDDLRREVCHHLYAFALEAFGHQ